MDIALIQAELIPAHKLNMNTGQLKDLGIPRNPRIIKDERYTALKDSILAHPEFLGVRSVVCYKHEEKLVVLGGNMRLKACKELGIKEIPCQILPKETPVEDLKAFVIKDNVSFGENDMELLTLDWNSEDLGDWGLELNWGGDKPEMSDEDLEKFFEPDTSESKEEKQKIILEYTDEEYELVKEAFGKIGGSREAIIWDLLGLNDNE